MATDAPSKPSGELVRHPLEPLSGEEITRTAAILRRDRGLAETARFAVIELREPAKEALERLAAGEVPDREAFAVVRDRRERVTHEAVVSLTRDRVLEWRAVPGVQPGFSRDEMAEADEAIHADPRFQEALRRRGIDPERVHLDLWVVGGEVPADVPAERRLTRGLAYVRESTYDNFYAHPIEGLVAVADVDTLEVVEVADHGAVPVPERPGNYIPELVSGELGGHTGNVPAPRPTRADLRPIAITQPEGPSFTVDGHAVSWQKWRLRLGYTRREGLVLHQIGYEDQGRVRPIIHRASLSELYVTYGDPNPTHRVKHVFDEGEGGMGDLLHPLMLGCDCLGEIRYFDVVVNDDEGEPLVTPSGICMHEEDVGVGWKHVDGTVGHLEVRRGRRLVISCFFTANYYDYGFFWYLYLDGTIEFEVKLTGIVSTGAFEPGSPPEHGTVLTEGLYAPYHQHFFNVRLDMCVDGPRNTVYEVDSVARDAVSWTTRATPLARESEAQRVADPLAGRHWTVVNHSAPNALGLPVGYRLVPGANILPLAGEGSQTHRRAGFAYRHLWVTAHDPAERYAAGDYPNQRPGDDGLPAYVRADRPLTDADLVLWYTFGAHHVPRPEDWPVMPVQRIGFTLEPAGFFDGNPALDLPRPAHQHGDHGEG